MQVTVFKLGSAPVTVDLPHGSTVEAALNAANIPLTGHSFAVNGEKVSSATEVPEGATITVTPKVTGGNR